MVFLGVPIPLWCDIFGAVLLALGGGATCLGLHYWRLAAASKRWPAAPGKVIRSGIEETEQSYEDRGRVTKYFAKVEYEYLVAGRRLKGDRIQFGGPPGSEGLGRIRAIVDRYAVGSTVDVYHDPANPSRCTLERSMATLGVAMLLLVGVVTLGIGTVMIAFIDL